MGELTFRFANKQDIKPICEMFTEAFLDYEFYTNYENDINKRRRFIYELQMLCFKTNLKRNQVVVGDENGQIVLGLAFQDPKKHQAGFWEYIFSGALKVLLQCGVRKVLSWFFLDEDCEKPVRQMMKSKPNVYYLHNFAVRKDMQSHGYGSRAIQEFLIPYIRNNGAEILTVITNAQKNVAFYTKNGFNIFNNSRFPCGQFEIENWCFEMKLT